MKDRAGRTGAADLPGFLDWLWPQTVAPHRFLRSNAMWLHKHIAALYMATQGRTHTRQIFMRLSEQSICHLVATICTETPYMMCLSVVTNVSMKYPGHVANHKMLCPPVCSVCLLMVLQQQVVLLKAVH
jgi:hypothetical protein